ncbi:zinc-binding alcohol dehydrogenase family protein [Brachybacterium sp. AOP25-B2-12]|uniref:zinc-binding alcohol dehydrogenase family protein n=1 Tax=Brachybacterium sp. AOP25-B2-12 TaxID=3457710 RepID=UPI004034ADC6
MTLSRALGYAENLPSDDEHAIITRDVEVPAPGPRDLLVEVVAVSVNPVDVKLRASAPAADGFRVLGFDAAGVVREVGDEAQLFRPGDAVFYAGTIDRPGSDQSLQLVDERIVGRRPRSVTAAEAAALPLTSITAWEALFDRLALTAQSEGTLLVVGATGGVGSMVLQLAEAMLPGVRVVATASDPQKEQWVRGLGAEDVVDHHRDLPDQLRDLGIEAVDWVFTAHSGGQIPVYAEIVRPFGAIVAIDDGARDVEPLKSKGIAWLWEFMFTRPLHRTDDLVRQHEILDAVAELVDAGTLRSTLTRTLTPITAATLREAHALVETGRTVGKVVVAQEG